MEVSEKELSHFLLFTVNPALTGFKSIQGIGACMETRLDIKVKVHMSLRARATLEHTLLEEGFLCPLSSSRMPLSFTNPQHPYQESFTVNFTLKRKRICISTLQM